MPLARPEAESGGGESLPCPSVLLIRVEGPLFFTSGFHLRSMVSRLPAPHRCLVLDLVQVLDVTGAEILEETVESLGKQGQSVVLAQPTASVARRLRELTRYEFPALRGCPVYETIRDGHAACGGRARSGEPVCFVHGQRPVAGEDPTRAMVEIGSLDRTPVPRVGLSSPASTAGATGTWRVSRLRRGETITPGLVASRSIRPCPPTSWNRRRTRPVIHPSAFVDPQATVIGAVTVCEKVYIGPGVSVRADEGTPFYIGPE